MNASTIKHRLITVQTGSELFRRKIPFISIESNTRGPVVWLTGCMHGDEIGGTVTIHEIIKYLKKELRCGSVYSFPLLNPAGFEIIQRNIPISEEDLNRAFPGEVNGTFAKRIAFKIFNMITETRPTLVIDLHNDWNKSIPYVLLDAVQDKNHTYQRNDFFAGASGLLKIYDTEIMKGTLTYNLYKKNIPALVLELGESTTINEENVVFGKKAIINILSTLKMTDSNEKQFNYPLPEELQGRRLDYSTGPLSSTSGIIRFKKKPGDLLRKKDIIASIHDSFGKKIDTISAHDSGIVLGHSDYSIAYPGAPLMAFGILKY